jgi:hypothetical protein
MNANCPWTCFLPATNHALKIQAGMKNDVAGPLASYVQQMQLIPLFWLRLPVKGIGYDNLCQKYHVCTFW